MDDRWNGAIFACDECKLRYDAFTEGICPRHETELVVAHPANLIPEYADVVACARCGSESTPAAHTDRGAMGDFRTDGPHCPDCGSEFPDRVMRRRLLTAGELAVLTERNAARQLEYDRVSAYVLVGTGTARGKAKGA